MWFVYAPIPIISMVDTGGSFSITANSTFDFTKYFTALQALFEAHGIPVLSKKNLGATKLMDTDFFVNLQHMLQFGHFHRTVACRE